jgi:hypothetical protein
MKPRLHRSEENSAIVVFFLLVFLFFIITIVGCGEPTKYPTPKYKKGDIVYLKGDDKPMVIEYIYNHADPPKYQVRQNTAEGLDWGTLEEFLLEQKDLKGEFP